MIRYVFRDEIPLVGFKNKKEADPQRIGEAIEKARKATAPGKDVRVLLEKQARSRRHALHKHLEWDDEVCGVKYRMEQINDLIRIIAIEDEDTREQTPAFISVTATPAPRAFYSPREIEISLELQIAALRSAERDLEAFERRHRWLTDICEGVAELRERIAKKRKEREDHDRPRDQPEA
jgi:hypothetical protein